MTHSTSDYDLTFTEPEIDLSKTNFISNYDYINTSWYEYPDSVKLVTKTKSIILKVGDCIIYTSRELPVRIDKFVGNEAPIGLEYLPWRGERWGTPTWGLRGNPRFIICIPAGLPHYGQHIDWESIEIVPNPDPDFRI
jgi:hypothetical protein